MYMDPIEKTHTTIQEAVPCNGAYITRAIRPLNRVSASLSSYTIHCRHRLRHGLDEEDRVRRRRVDELRRAVDDNFEDVNTHLYPAWW